MGLPLTLFLAATLSIARAESDDSTIRLRFIQSRLRQQVPTAMLWHLGWVGFYSIGALYQTSRAVMATDEAEIADGVVGTVKAVLGVVGRLAVPIHSIQGSSEIDGMAEGSPDERARKLARAEELLRRNARESDRRYSLWSHGLNLLLNVGGGLVVALGYHDTNRALISSGVGIAVGELSIWSQPWRAKSDLREYQRRFAAGTLGRAPAPGPSLTLIPVAGGEMTGMALGGRF